MTLSGGDLGRRAAVAAAIPPVLRLAGGRASVGNLAAELRQPERLVRGACRALERHGWVAVAGDRVALTAQAEATLDGWESEIGGAL